MMTVIRKRQLVMLVIGVAIVSGVYIYYDSTKGSLPVIDEISDPLLTDKLEQEVFSTDENLVEENAENTYFDNARIERDRVREQEIYVQEMVINSDSESKEAYKLAQEELKKINEKSEKEMIAENMIKAKGFKDVVVFINGDTINVVVDNNDEDMEQNEIVQIKECIVDEIGTDYNLKIVSK